MEDIPIVDFKRVNVPRLPRGVVTLAVAGLVALLVGFNSLYQIQPEEVGVVLRFGRYVRTTEPGLRAKFPFAEEVLKVPVQRQLKQEFGFRTIDAGIRTQYALRAAVRRRGGDADRRPQRRRRRVDRAVPAWRTPTCSSSRCATSTTPSAP